MLSLATESETVITLKGSVDIITEFFTTAINSILYQRGIYQPESFRRESKYGLTVLTTTDEGLLSYLDNIMSQMGVWLTEGNVQRLVVVVSGVDSGETLERWQFNVSVDDENQKNSKGVSDENDTAISNSRPPTSKGESHTTTTTKTALKGKKSLKKIHNEIAAIIRQITASVTFLPLLTEPCSFDLLVYTDKSTVVPQKWEDSDPRYIMDSQEVKLRSFTTSVHKVDSMVTYKEADEWDLT